MTERKTDPGQSEAPPPPTLPHTPPSPLSPPLGLPGLDRGPGRGGAGPAGRGPAAGTAAGLRPRPPPCRRPARCAPEPGHRGAFQAFLSQGNRDLHPRSHARAGAPPCAEDRGRPHLWQGQGKGVPPPLRQQHPGQIKPHAPPHVKGSALAFSESGAAFPSKGRDAGRPPRGALPGTTAPAPPPRSWAISSSASAPGPRAASTGWCAAQGLPREGQGAPPPPRPARQTNRGGV